jgi:hypothetical protein
LFVAFLEYIEDAWTYEYQMQKLLFVLRATQHIYMPCDQHAEFFNVEPGGI